MSVKFTDNRITAKKMLKEKAIQFLVESSELIVAQTARNTAVKTGELKRSWRTQIDNDNLEAQVGSDLENAIWEELGTGEYALEGKGRKTPWVYKDKVTGKFYKTSGKKPKRALYKAFKSLRNTIVERAEKIMKEIN